MRNRSFIQAMWGIRSKQMCSECLIDSDNEFSSSVCLFTFVFFLYFYWRPTDLAVHHSSSPFQISIAPISCIKIGFVFSANHRRKKVEKKIANVTTLTSADCWAPRKICGKQQEYRAGVNTLDSQCGACLNGETICEWEPRTLGNSMLFEMTLICLFTLSLFSFGSQSSSHRHRLFVLMRCDV